MNHPMIFFDEFVCCQALQILSKGDIFANSQMTAELESYRQRQTLEKYLEINSWIHIYIWESLNVEYLFSLIKHFYDHFLMYDTQVLYSYQVEKNSKKIIGWVGIGQRRKI